MFLSSAVTYDDADFAGMVGLSDSGSSFEPTLSLNCVAPNVDTLATQLLKSRPLPMPLTTGGNYSQQKRARLLGRCIEGQFQKSKVWETNQFIVRDSVLYGTGFGYAYRVRNEIKYDRVFPWEVDVDPRDAMYGSPRTMYLTRSVDRLVLKDMFPGNDLDIEKADADFDDFFLQGVSSTSDCVVVVEAWHLPSGEDAEDGKHYICINNKVLSEEEYTYDVFPIFPLYMMPPSFGFYGNGFGRQLMGFQYTLNVLADKAQQDAIMAPNYLLVPNGSDIQVDALDNSTWPIINHNQGFAPTTLQAPPFNQQMWQLIKDIYGMTFDRTGVSQIAAQSELPKALREASGSALQMHNEQRSERFNIAAKMYEAYCVAISWHFIRLFDEITKNGGKVKVKAPSKKLGRRIIEELNYKKVKLDHDQFILDVYPTSFLKMEPTMRAAQVESWINAKFISPDEGRMLLDFPDIDRVNSMNRAKFEIVDEIIEKMLDEDVDIEDAYTAPEPLFDLDLCIIKGLEHYMKSKLDGEPEERLQLLRDFILQSQDMKKEMANPQGAAPPPPGAPPDMGMGPPPPEGTEPPPEGGPPGGGGMTPTELASNMGP
jgi:hypothetical protein